MESRVEFWPFLIPKKEYSQTLDRLKEMSLEEIWERREQLYYCPTLPEVQAESFRRLIVWLVSPFSTATHLPLYSKAELAMIGKDYSPVIAGIIKESLEGNGGTSVIRYKITRAYFDHALSPYQGSNEIIYHRFKHSHWWGRLNGGCIIRGRVMIEVFYY